MLPVNISYPFFEANQVLSNEHLNQLFNYLDEQERLTRTNLIGIGIVCGLEPSVAASGDSIQLSQGCGVTSEGYLISWGTQAALEWYRPYEVPDALPYREFGSGNNPFTSFPIWELTADRNNDPTAVRVSADFLGGINQSPGEGDEKILVLFLECEAESNRNCTPNSCNDKGSTVTATIRPLLMRKQDIDLLQERIRALGPAAEAYFSLADSLSSRLDLPTLKLPRFDVAATSLGSTSSVFSAFQLAMNQPVVEGVATALSAAHQAFAPLLTDFPANPFTNLSANWSFLYDGSIETSGQYLWYQYYYDHLDTIIQAYEEFRLRGLEVLGLCCPDSRLFKRHLFAGNLALSPPDNSYRHSFVPSPLFTRQQGALAELRLLFARLVSLVQGLELPPNVNTLQGFNVGNIRPITSVVQPGIFTATETFIFSRPQVFTAFRPRLSTQLKITPSLLGGPLSKKAIPYHYRPVPLYEQWSYHLTRQGKARHNLGYRSSAWNTTDLFVRFPLRYDLEPNNFLRIEGHIGQNYVQVLNELLTQKNRNRLPIDIVALKSGFNADNIPLPTEVENCHFQDLESLYDAFREELLCQICEGIKRFYLTPILPNEEPVQFFGNRVPQLPFLQQCAPNFRYFDSSVGAYYEENLSQHTATAPYLGNLASVYIYHVLFIFNLVKLAEVIPENVAQLDMTLFRQQHNALTGLMQVLNNYLLQITNDANPVGNNSSNQLDLEEFSDQLDHVLFACKLESFQRIFDEYQDRLEKVRERLLFTKFTDQHPGIQHKAGVPMGGTFVLVYHGDDQPDDVPVRQGSFTVRGRVVADGEAVVGVNIVQVGTTSGTVTDFGGNFTLVVNSLPARLEVIMADFESREVIILTENTILEIDLSAPADDNSDLGRFADLAIGTVIADFYLPYLCCSDCMPIQFVLPKAPPTFTWEQVGCTTPNNTGSILITPAGGTPPYDYSSDGGVNWETLPEDAVVVNNGVQVQVRDAEGTISVRRTIELLPPLVIDPGGSECDADGQNFRTSVFIAGGRPPYRVIANGQTYEVPLGETTGYASFPSGQGGEVVVEDSSDPACERRFAVDPISCEQACELPCDGAVRESGHPFWIQRNPNNGIRYRNVQLQVNAFTVIGDQPGQVLNFTGTQLDQLTEILNPDRNFNSAGAFSGYWNAQIPLANEFIQSVLGDLFGSPNDPVIQLTYDAAGVDNFTTLRIEHYECHRFRLEIQVNFEASSAKHVYQRTWSYTEEGSTVREVSFLTNFGEFEGRGSLPAYNSIRRNRCNPDFPDTALCQDPQSLNIGVENTGDFQHLLFAENGGERSILWMTEYGLPAVNNSSQANLTAPPLEVTYVVRAIAVDRDTTCAAVATTTINP